MVWHCEESSVLKRAQRRWNRDLDMTLLKNLSGEKTEAVIEKTAAVAAEAYRIQVENDRIHIFASDDLGVIYALLFLSEKFLGILPFWYWNDQKLEKKAFVNVPEGVYRSQEYKLRYRGWFINDEVLLDDWGMDIFDDTTGINENFAFEMAMEALLRLGGNMVIPGTDHNSHKNRKLAADMGLWLTHHHAEPLGATMFARAYPDLTASYAEYPELFEQLWRSAIEEQISYRVVWNIGFRGQGDRPFWADDPQYDTPEKRGALISSLIEKQYRILCEYMDNPICCTNLYGEVMELYQQGYITLPEQVIYIWADNGYGKMVSRRQDTHNPRVEALPPKPEGKHGIYYHVSFYDLQAAAHITMLPNSTDFIEKELRHAMERGVQEFLIVNCSNIRPHTYMLNKIAEIWGKSMEPYTAQYFPSHEIQVETLYQQYAKAVVRYGANEDEHAGEQYYHYNIRAICHAWLQGRFEEPEPSLVWLTGAVNLSEQVNWILENTNKSMTRMKNYYISCQNFFEKMQQECQGKNAKSDNEIQLFADSLLLQATIHYESIHAQKLVCVAYQEFRKENYEKAFFKAGEAVSCILRIEEAQKLADHGKWEGFYDNECLADMKFTAYMTDQLMGYIRNIGDGPQFYQWALKYMGKEEDASVVLITNMRRRPTAWELYLGMKKKQA